MPIYGKALLYGDWDSYSGQYFSEWRNDPEHYSDHKWTHVIDPFDIPAHWTIYRSFDWGYARPFSVQWHAVDGEGKIYHFMELYGCTGTPNEGVKQTPHEVFAEVARVEREHPWLAGRNVIGIADPAIWDAQTGESIADVAAKYGVYFSPGDHKRIPGWLQCHYRLSFSEDGDPMFQVFKTCKHFIRTIPLLQFDDKKIEDIDTGMEDHAADAWRYCMMARVISPRAAKPRDEWFDNPAFTYLGIERGDLTRLPEIPKMEVIG